MTSSSAVKTHIKFAENKFLSGDIHGALRSAYRAKMCCTSDCNSRLADKTIAAYNVHKVVLNVRNNREIDWYAVLGISDPTVAIKTINKCYKKLALMVHPDKNISKAAEAAFKLVGQAWKILSNSSSRNKYHARGAQSSRSSAAQTDVTGDSAYQDWRYRKSPEDYWKSSYPQYESMVCRFCGDSEFKNGACIHCWTQITAVQEEYHYTFNVNGFFS